MKKILKIMIFFLALVSCREDIDTNNIVGTWKLTAQLMDPGDGSGKFLPVNSSRTVTFRTDGTYISNGSFCNINIEANQNTDGTYIYSSTEKKLTPKCFTIGLLLPTVLSMKIENGNLIISNYGCIEPCAQKFTKIKD